MARQDGKRERSAGASGKKLFVSRGLATELWEDWSKTRTTNEDETEGRGVEINEGKRMSCEMRWRDGGTGWRAEPELRRSGLAKYDTKKWNGEKKLKSKIKVLGEVRNPQDVKSARLTVVSVF